MVSKKALIAFPNGLLEELDVVAASDYRTRSEFVREAVRYYMNHWKLNHIGRKDAFREKAETQFSK